MSPIERYLEPAQLRRLLKRLPIFGGALGIAVLGTIRWAWSRPQSRPRSHCEAHKRPSSPKPNPVGSPLDMPMPWARVHMIGGYTVVGLLLLKLVLHLNILGFGAFLAIVFGGLLAFGGFMVNQESTRAGTAG